MMRAALVQCAENARGLLFVAGACWLYVGIAGFSVPAANVTAGAILMAVGATPYFLRKRHP